MKQYKNNGRIKWKVFRSFLIFIAIILFLLWALQFFLLDDIYKIIKRYELTDTADTIAEKIVLRDSVVQSAAELSDKREICVRIFEMKNEDSGQMTVDIKSLKNCLIHNTEKYTVFTLYDAAAERGGRFLQRFRYDSASSSFYSVSDNLFSQSNDTESMVLSQIITDIGGTEHLLILNSVLSPVSATVNTIFIILCGISIVMLLLGFALALILSRRISAPIVSINRNAKELADGKYDTEFEARGYKEICELGDTLNYAARELGKADSLRRELISNVSHDLRTPLTLITGYAEAMRDLPDENSPENLQIIIDEAKRMSSLLCDMLDISKLESGVTEASLDEVNVTESVKDTVKRYNKLLGRDGYVIEFEYDAEYTATTDISKLLQALCNLINNAVTYTGEDKRVTVKQEQVDSPEGKRLRLSVTDTGDGIEADKLTLIWERYYKVGGVHKRATVGTGLGLSIVKRIAELLGGSTGVVSTPGAGSTFHIEIPYTEQSGTPQI